MGIENEFHLINNEPLNWKSFYSNDELDALNAKIVEFFGPPKGKTLWSREEKVVGLFFFLAADGEW